MYVDKSENNLIGTCSECGERLCQNCGKCCGCQDCNCNRCHPKEKTNPPKEKIPENYA